MEIQIGAVNIGLSTSSVKHKDSYFKFSSKIVKVYQQIEQFLKEGGITKAFSFFDKNQDVCLKTNEIFCTFQHSCIFPFEGKPYTIDLLKVFFLFYHSKTVYLLCVYRTKKTLEITVCNSSFGIIVS